MSSEDFEEFDEDDDDEDGTIVSARNPELARRMESMRQDMIELEKRAEQADALAKRALDLVNEQDERIDDLEETNEELRDRIATLEGRVTPDPTTMEYSEMSRDERVRAVRLSCARKAAKNGGKASIDYNDVSATLDHHPSNGYCYKLLNLAAGLDGFTRDKRDGGNDRLCVNLDDVNDDSVFHAVNKDRDGGGR